MLHIVQFEDTLRYGIKNSLTNTALRKGRWSDYALYSYRSKKRAIRKMNKLAKKFNKTVRSLQK